MALTDVAIRNAKPAATTRKLSDGGGLQLWVTPTGSKLWRLAYRFDRKQKKLSIGTYPETSLEAARRARASARQLLAAGKDPSEQKKIDAATSRTMRANTFAAIADELLEKKRREERAPATIDKRAWLYDMAAPSLGGRPIAEVTAAEILAVLRPVEAQGKLETAHRLRATIGEVFRYAIATARASTDPTFGLRGALTAKRATHRSAIVDPKAFGELLRAIDACGAQQTTKAALQLMALLFPRPGELRAASWSEFDFEERVWTVPATRTKMRRTHRVPLPRQAITILQGLRSSSGSGNLVLPGMASTRKPISENTMNVALRRMGYAKEQMTAHGFRATASTLLNESGMWSPDAIERALAHQEPDNVRRAYSRGQNWEERVKMAQWWADKLDRLREGGKVLALHGNQAP